MSWEKIIKNRMAKDPVQFANELLDDIIYDRMRLNEEELEFDDMDYPFDFNTFRKQLETIVTKVYDAIDNYYEEEFTE
jgi:hypothetical protein